MESGLKVVVKKVLTDRVWFTGGDNDGDITH